MLASLLLRRGFYWRGFTVTSSCAGPKGKSLSEHPWLGPRMWKRHRLLLGLPGKSKPLRRQGLPCFTTGKYHSASEMEPGQRRKRHRLLLGLPGSGCGEARQEVPERCRSERPLLGRIRTSCEDLAGNLGATSSKDVVGDTRRRRSSTLDELGPKIQTYATRVAVLHYGELSLGKRNGNRDSKGIRGMT